MYVRFHLLFKAAHSKPEVDDFVFQKLCLYTVCNKSAGTIASTLSKDAVFCSGTIEKVFYL